MCSIRPAHGHVNALFQYYLDNVRVQAAYVITASNKISIAFDKSTAYSNLLKRMIGELIIVAGQITMERNDR
jgi:hypothetical protein